MLQVNTFSGRPVIVLLLVSAVLGGLMAGFFFAYSVSVVLALRTLSASEYTTVMQEINEKVLNVVFGIVFFGTVVVPVGSAILVVVRGQWTTLSSQLFLAGLIVYLVGTFLVTMRIHIPMNDRIATWSPGSPPDEWATVRSRWARWNHVRTMAAVVSFALYIAAIASSGE
ncbi:DUF1772 domain-containing protein [Saliphagus sp. LR7]|uniref:anthrone oxygenase family protein n=1 Tax=Saliphagus sp. LR7 TaxID=2282654 RepID=UPI001300650E|nr:anthrone oxygenase family protein [Saliphagus sp. LR7]